MNCSTRSPDFRRASHERLSVLVRTSAGDDQTRDAVIDRGATEFITKSDDPTRTVESILVYLGRDVRVASTLIEIVDVDEIRREVEIRYRTPFCQYP